MVVWLDSGERYVAHWKFDVNDVGSVTGITKSESNKASFNSKCDSTMVGFIMQTGGTFE